MVVWSLGSETRHAVWHLWAKQDGLAETLRGHQELVGRVELWGWFDRER